MQHTPTDKDPILWEIAQKRAGFKKSFAIYVFVNIFLWAIWFFTKSSSNYVETKGYNIPWPIWPTLGCGIAIALQYVGAYISPKSLSAEREYDKLKGKE